VFKLFEKKTRWYKQFGSLSEAEDQVPLYKTETLWVGKKKICLARTEEGFFAVSDRCPHNGFSLGMGWCTPEQTVVCPLHRYAFDLRTGRAKTGLAAYVDTYPVEIRPEGLFIGVEETVFILFGDPG
jgi:nitrite reductase/ring-hydroxylating ferredoxin subunit